MFSICNDFQKANIPKPVLYYAYAYKCMQMHLFAMQTYADKDKDKDKDNDKDNDNVKEEDKDNEKEKDKENDNVKEEDKEKDISSSSSLSSSSSDSKKAPLSEYRLTQVPLTILRYPAKATPHEDCAQIAQSAFSSDCTDFPKEYYRISRKKCVI